MATRDNIYKFEKSEIGSWGEFAIELLFCGGFSGFALVFILGMTKRNGKASLIKYWFQSVTINKWLWFAITLLIITFSMYPMYKITKYFKKSSIRQADWHRLIERLNRQPKEHQLDVKFQPFKETMNSHTVQYMNYLFMPNQSFGKAFQSLLTIIGCAIINSLSITAILNFCFVLLSTTVNGIIIISPKIMHGIQWLWLQIMNGAWLEVILIGLILFPFLFAKRNKPQWAKYSLLAMQFGGFLGLALKLLLL